MESGTVVALAGTTGAPAISRTVAAAHQRVPFARGQLRSVPYDITCRPLASFSLDEAQA
jgi:hypothetical protein